MNFCSDNVTGICPEILAAIIAANEGEVMSYGEDDYTQRLQTLFSERFETPVTVFPMITGSAANALALAAIVPPYGAIYCHREAHINVDECGAPEFYTGGAKLVTLAGEHAKISATDLAAVLDRAGTGIVHHVQPAAVSITQATEAGTVYTPDEIAAIAAVAHAHQLPLHVDGARFANAVVHLGLSPADLTWRVGVDVLSLGATKNGAMTAEAVVFFKQELAQSFAFRRKRAGHLFSKMRFLSAQLEAYLTNDLWLKNAAHANMAAAKLEANLTGVSGVKFCHPVQANELFISLPESVIEKLLAEGFKFYPWQSETGDSTIRLVTAFNTEDEAVNALIATIKRHSVSLVSG